MDACSAVEQMRGFDGVKLRTETHSCCTGAGSAACKVQIVYGLQ